MMGKEFKIENHFNAAILFEISAAINGLSYLIIYGKHINGYFCCVPRYGWGCEMAAAESIDYNTNKLISAGATPDIAMAIAKAILYYQKGKEI